MTSAFTSRSRAPVLLALLACAVTCVAISSQSFWIDETQTALKAVAPTLHGWWHALYQEHNSNMQLPLYMIYIWGWARVFGVSEALLRAGNIPWFFVGFFAISHFLRSRPSLRNAALLIYCLHPFVWYYLDEARPYIMQLSGALLASGALFAALEAPDEPLPSSWWWLFMAGIFILCGAGILGVPWAVVVLIPLVCCPGFRRSAFRSGLPALIVSVPLFVLLGSYFGWTVIANVQTGRMRMSVASMLAVFYEQLGLLGLGPGKNDLRAGSVSTLHPYLLPLSLLALPLGWGLFLAARRRFGLTPARLVSVLLLAAIPVCLIFTLGFLRHARVLGRHFSPLFPLILLAEAYLVLLFWESGRPVRRAAALLCVAALAVSSLEIRFAARHAKDDYRAAAAAATQTLAQGKTVWWCAARAGALYYHVPVSTTDTPGAVRWTYGVPAHFTKLPDMIVLTKPDLGDPNGSIATFVAAHHYHIDRTLQSFTIWKE
jgi:hypothetical protein